MSASMSHTPLLDKLKQERDELTRLERMLVAQRQKVVELERQAFNNTYDTNARRRGQYESQLPALPPCPVTKGCWLAPGHVGHCD